MKPLGCALYNPVRDAAGVNPLFYNGDKVVVRTLSDNIPQGKTGIVSIIYLPNLELNISGRPKYDIVVNKPTDDETPPWETPENIYFVSESDIVIQSRGNLWCYYSDQPLEFHGIKEKAKFFLDIGRVTQIKSPDGDTYVWESFDDITKQLLTGRIDTVRWSSNCWHAFKYDDPILGRLVRDEGIMFVDDIKM